MADFIWTNFTFLTVTQATAFRFFFRIASKDADDCGKNTFLYIQLS